MRKNLVTASAIAVTISLWLLSGLFFGESAPEAHAPIAQQAQNSDWRNTTEHQRVRIRLQAAEPRTRFLVLRGRTESKRMVDIKAEVAGRVVSRPVERGMQVAEGDVLCELAIDDREVSVSEAKAALEDARIEYQGSLKLKEQGLQSQMAIARSAAKLESARARLHRENLNLERTRIVAPFGGMVENLHLNMGDYASPGVACATLIDLDPMLVSAEVTEAEVEKLQLGDTVLGRTSGGREVRGTLTFVAKQSDPATRTYPVEVTVENADYSIRSGLTTSMRIALDEVLAHRVSPALLSLNDRGELGIRTVGEKELVEFHPVQIIEDTSEGVWVTGLPDPVHLITVGQEFVLAGQRIDPVYPENTSAATGPL